MKKFAAFIVLSSLLTIAVVALAQATVLEQAPAPSVEAPGSPASALAEPSTLV